MPASSTAASPSPAPVIILPLLALLVGCTPGDDPRVLDGTEGEASADTDSSDTDASEAESDTDTSESDPSTDTTTGDSCPEPSEEPMLVDDPSVFCSLGFRFDATYRLCASETEAIGPFPPAMVAACEDCGGQDCAGDRWPVDQARGLRGTDACWPGTEALAPICVDDEHGWGPFTPGMVDDCKAAGGGDVTCESMRWARDFAENLLPPALGQDWVWIMPLDLGLRDDSGGGGAFSATRINNPGGHSGIDVLAPVGTDLLAPCSGPVLTGFDAGYGNYVQLACPIPPVIAGGESLWASLLFAHMDSLAVASDDSVSPGQVIGTVGKTGNAGSSSINPHVHFEIAIHASLGEAQAESHASANHSANAAGDAFAPRFASACLDELGFESTTGPTMKGRRPDPFMLMTCLSSDKPTLEAPEPALQSTWTRWSDHYAADAFDVDVGL